MVAKEQAYDYLERCLVSERSMAVEGVRPGERRTSCRALIERLVGHYGQGEDLDSWLERRHEALAQVRGELAQIFSAGVTEMPCGQYGRELYGSEPLTEAVRKSVALDLADLEGRLAAVAQVRAELARRGQLAGAESESAGD